VLTSHHKTVEETTKTEKYNKHTITIGGQNGEFVKGFVDYILFIDSEMVDDKEVRIIKCRASKYWDAGGRDKKLPEKIPLDFKELSKYFKEVTK